MIAHWNIQQGSEEWHAMRYRKITGTTASGLLVKSDTLLIKLLGEFGEPYEPEEDGYQSVAMIRGHELQPMALKALSQYTGHDFLDCGFLQCEINRLLGISPDGITKSLDYMAEIKCPGKTEHAKTIYNGIIPDDHLDQMLHCFTVNPHVKGVWFASFRPEHEIVPLFAKLMDLNSLVDMGTKAKPNVKMVSEWVEILRFQAAQVDTNLDIALCTLKSI